MRPVLKKIVLSLSLLGALKVSTSFATGQIDAFEVVDRTMSCGTGGMDCMDWQLKGVCFWLRCTFFSCSVKESPKVFHYIPDLLVSTYTTESPIDMSTGVNPTSNGNLTQDEKGKGELETYLDYKHAEVLGNPTALLFNSMAQSDYFCQSVVQVPYMQYFLSGVDPFWNSPSVEHYYPQAILGFPKIKTNFPLGYWAQIYPLCGWGSHPYDAINAAVDAHRAAVIVTSPGVPHVYQPVGRSCGNRCWPPGQVQEGQLSTHKFQMIYPKTAHSGMVMGGSASWANGKNEKLNEQYAWSLWRPYTCCHRKGQVFLFSIDW